MASFLIVWKIRSYLVRAKLYPLVRRVVSFKCGGRHCQGCLDVTETGRLTSTSTNQTFKMNHEFNCSESSLIYLLMCRVCRKQYVGQTADTLRSRWNNCKSNDRMLIIPVCKNIFEHFNSEGHTGFLQNVSVTFNDKTDSQNPEKEKIIEYTL